MQFVCVCVVSGLFLCDVWALRSVRVVSAVCVVCLCKVCALHSECFLLVVCLC